MKGRTRRVTFLVTPGVELLDLVGPWQVLGHANDLLGRSAYELSIWGPSYPSVRGRHGLELAGVRPLPRALLHPPDLVVVAGGSPAYPLPTPERRLVAWLRRHHAKVGSLVSICTGAFVLAEAGLLDGRRATTHWEFLAALRARYPAAHVVDEGIFVRDGRVWTSAGISAGIDLALALVEEHHGHAAAMSVAKRLVLFLRRSGGQQQFSTALRRQELEPPTLRELSVYIVEHLGEPLPVERLARSLGMSARSLNRWCSRYLGESPAALVRRLRLEEARRLLEETSLGVKEIAARTGLGDASTLFRLFERQLGVTPLGYRARFAARAHERGAARVPSRARSRAGAARGVSRRPEP